MIKPDITRSTFDPSAQYRKVLMQQGRVQVDADWNEQVDILDDANRQLLKDIVGPAAAPGDNDFKISLVDGTLAIQAGAYYVDGVGVYRRDGGAVPLPAQPFLPGYRLPGPDGPYTAYLDIWLRTLNGVEAPAIIDPALGGRDTAQRAQLIWQVRLQPGDKFVPPTRTTGQMTVAVDEGDRDDVSTLVPPGAGYTGLENYLYLIEIHASGAAGEATFKWSRYNGSLGYAIERCDGNEITLASLGPDAARGLARGDWIELVDNNTILNGSVSPLYRITDVYESERKIVVAPEPTGFDPKSALAPMALRWDQRSGADADGVLPIPADGGPVAIEHGISVTFLGKTAHFESGDFWTIPARANVGLLWPQVPADKPGDFRYVPQPPAGIVHHYAPLATCQHDGSWSVTRDLRPVFQPLADFKKWLDARNVHFASALPIFAGVNNVYGALEKLADAAALTPIAVTIGPTGQFPTLLRFFTSLSPVSPPNIALSLLAGEHTLEATLGIKPWRDDLPCSLALTGVARSATLNVTQRLTVDGALSDKPKAELAEFALSGLRLLITTLRDEGSGLHIANVKRVVVNDCFLFGNRQMVAADVKPAVLSIAGANEIVVSRSDLIRWSRGIDGTAGNIIAGGFAGFQPLIDLLQKLYSMEDVFDPRVSFDPAAADASVAIAALQPAQRQTIVGQLTTQIAQRRTTDSDILLDGFAALASTMSGTPALTPLGGALRGIFDAIIQSNPDTALRVGDRAASVIMEDNRILGLVVLGGSLTEPVYTTDGYWQRTLAGIDLTDRGNLGLNIAAGRLGSTAGSARFVNNEVAAVTLGDAQLETVIELTKTPSGPTLSGVYRDIVMSGNRIAGFSTFLLAETVLLAGNSLYTPWAVPKSGGRYRPLTSALAASNWLSATGNNGNFTPPASPGGDQPSYILMIGAPDKHAVAAANPNLSTKPSLA